MIRSLVFSLPVAANEEYEDVYRVCTIGWYKNNGFDSWYNVCLAANDLDPTSCDALVDDLHYSGSKLNGMSAGDIKNAAADRIVKRYLVEGIETCDEANGYRE